MNQSRLSKAAERFLIAFGDGCMEFWELPREDTVFTVGGLDTCFDDDYYSVGGEADLSPSETDIVIKELVEGDFIIIARDVPAIQFNPSGTAWYVRQFAPLGDDAEPT